MAPIDFCLSGIHLVGEGSGVRGMGFQMLQRQSEDAKKTKNFRLFMFTVIAQQGFNFCACGHPLKGGELGHKYLATENIIISAIGAQHVGTHTPLSALLGWSWRSHYDRKSSKEFLIFCTVAWTRVHHDETGFQGRPCVHYFLVTCTANSIKQSSVPRSQTGRTGVEHCHLRTAIGTLGRSARLSGLFVCQVVFWGIRCLGLMSCWCFSFGYSAHTVRHITT